MRFLNLLRKSALVWAVVALVVLAACGGGDSDDTARANAEGEQGSTEPGESTDGSPAEGETADGSGSLELTTQLPREARYGHLDIAVTEAEVREDHPFEDRQDDPSDYVGFELDVTNRLKDGGFTIPAGIFTFAGGDDFDETGFAEADIAVDADDTVAAKVWFEVPPDTDLSDPRLIVAETDFEPEIVALSGEASQSPQRIETSPSKDSVDNGGAPGPDPWTSRLEFGESWIDFDAGEYSDGQARSAPSSSPLGRAPLGFAYLHGDLTCTERSSSTATFFYVFYTVYTWVKSVQIGDTAISGADDCGQVDSKTVDRGLALQIPLDSPGTLELTLDRGWDRSDTVTWSVETLPESKA
jgi:hypothetical protein